METAMVKNPYPSDLADKEPALIELVLEAARDPRRRKQKYPLRAIVNGNFMYSRLAANGAGYHTNTRIGIWFTSTSANGVSAAPGSRC
jgi:hypothetical protein